MQLDSDVEILVTQIHAAKKKLVYIAAGGGTQAVAWLQSVPGCSKTLLEAIIPYDRKAIVNYLDGLVVDRFANTNCAHFLAGRAFSRALSLRDPNDVVFGFSCSAALKTEKPKKRRT